MAVFTIPMLTTTRVHILVFTIVITAISADIMVTTTLIMIITAFMVYPGVLTKNVTSRNGVK